MMPGETGKTCVPGVGFASKPVERTDTTMLTNFYMGLTT